MSGFTSADWESVPEYYLDGRSKVPFPDPDPEGTAKMWEEWKADRARRTALRVDAPVVDEDATDDVYKNHEPPVITLEAEEFDDPVSSLASYVKLACGNGWTLIELAHSQCFAKGKTIKSGARAGETHPDREIETQWMKIEKLGVGRAVVSYTIINGKTDSVYRSFNTLNLSDKDMKAAIKQ